MIPEVISRPKSRLNIVEVARSPNLRVQSRIADVAVGTAIVNRQFVQL